jgi:RHS repeat-associated protein
MRNRILTATATMLLLFPLLSWAGVEWGQEYDRQLKTKQTVSSFGPELFGESVNLYDGTVSFSASDLDIPGNGGLPMVVSRSFSIGNPKNAALDGLFGNWDMALPYVGVVWDGGAPLGQTPNPNALWPGSGGSQARCTQSAIGPELGGASGGGYLFALEGASPKLVRPTMPGMRWVTKGFWYFGCTPTLASGHPGEGYVGVDPSGTKYTFNWMVSHFYPGSSLPGMGLNQIQVHRADVRLYPTRVEDRLGNWVNYQWQGRRLLSMTASDGRRVDFAYGADDQIVKATSNGRSWTYSYADSASAGIGGRLTAVTNPDGTRWSYGQDPGDYVDFEPKYEMRLGETPGGSPMMREYEVLEKVGRCSYDHYLSTVQRAFEVTHPTGARAVFSFKTMRHGRTGVPAKCEYGWGVGGEGNVSDEQNSQNMYPAFKVVMSLQSKRVEGPGLAALTWQYGYTNLQGCVGHECVNQGTPTRKQVTVTSPDGDQTMSTFGKQFGENEGQLLSVQTMRGGVVASRTDYDYVSNAQAAQMPFPAYVGESIAEYPEIWNEAGIRPMSGAITIQDGVTFWNATSSFDAFARPVSVTRENTKGYKKTDVTEYYDNLSYWVIGQPAREYNAETGMVKSRIDYNDKALPWKTYAFGKLQSTTLYNADGTVASVADGRNNAMVLSDWKRGIPQSIRYPATPESPAGAVESAVIDDNGWLVSHTEENGYTTSYDYDAMGRLIRIKYPVGDASIYHDATFSLNQLAAGDWLPPGVVAGQWYRAETTGSARKLTYLDAMWRPVLEHTYDADNLVATLSATRTQYDSDGQVIFKSYPSSQPGADAPGVRSYYDALGRSVRQEQDSDHNALVTKTEYLADLQVRVTNPRGYQTTTRYMAWDQPDYELAVWSSQPEGKVIEVTRHPQFGWPLQLTQRNADGSLRQDRKYIYDGAAQLCKTIEPETGATVMGYDEAGNLAWSAAGHHDLTSAATCNHAEGYGWGRRVDRSYDARDRLTALSFPDGRGNQTWRYTPDGLPASVTTYNDIANGAPVVNAYSYNRRRLLAGESVTQPHWYSWGIGYNYDANGNLSMQTYPTGLVVNYAPNALGQPTRAGGYATGVEYYPNGAIKRFVYGNGIVHTMTQNARQLPERVIDGGNALDFAYGYDLNGNVEVIYDSVIGTPTAQHRYMKYDGLDRLEAVGSQMFGGDHWHRFTYDELDNLKSWKLAGVKDYAGYIYDTKNRLTNIKNTAGASVVGLDYDVQGNLTNKNGQVYGFDFGNRLRSASSRESYRYDGSGRRVQTTRADGTQTLWQYSQAGHMLFSWEGPAAQKTHENVYLGGSLVATIDHDWPSNAVTAVKYQHTDALGSPVAVTNTAGVVIERTNYEPYGAAINKTVNGIGYTGHVMDGATGLTYMQQRYYDPVIGRFLSVDPVTADANTGANFNRYRYADNNPYKFVDPDGRQSALQQIGYFQSEHVPRMAQYVADNSDVKLSVAAAPQGKGLKVSYSFRENSWKVEAIVGKGYKFALVATTALEATYGRVPFETSSNAGSATFSSGGFVYGAEIERSKDDRLKVKPEIGVGGGGLKQSANVEIWSSKNGWILGTAKPKTSVQTAVEAPQGKYRKRTEK